MRVLPVLLASTALLGGCATPMAPGPDGPPMAADGNDCAVIAAIAKEHYRFNTTDNRPPPIKFDGDFAPRCDWSRYGLAFTAYNPDAPGDPRERVRWVSFSRVSPAGRSPRVPAATPGCRNRQPVTSALRPLMVRP